MVSTKSAARGAMPRPARAFRARTFPPSAAACALLLAAQCLWAQQDNPPPSKPRVSVVVTGVYEPVPLGEVDRPITQIDVKSNELVTNSLEDFLRLDSSIDLQERGVNGTQADVAMRGGTFEQTLILVDGFRMNDLQTGHHDMDLPFPVDSFSDVEVLHGAGSAMYGSDAVGGAINFITHAPPVTELRVRGAIGNFGVNQESGTGSVVDGRLFRAVGFSRAIILRDSPPTAIIATLNYLH